MKNFLLKKVITWITGDDFFGEVVKIVRSLADENMSGEKKRAEAKARLGKIQKGTKSFIVNLAIEAALYLMKTEKQ